MKDILGILSDLRRPRLLIRAARIGAQDYCRDAHLNRLLGYGSLPRPGAALMQLVELESEMNAHRQRQSATYSVSRHVALLTAMMGEARLLRETRQA
ncbi:DUF6477 family protein [Pseudoponticoccus marisrubri]|uniref:Uncharacterized protein n=1 Tax=Pseudoponticoccus marisrubri TaxID=1685382 RepID=A0A0W7WPD1_9RHOB|nr:DUF6477 family protein [Pseudoponticoccus marisrubri]KUF12360.1 hypothetical protein AVJ23_01105 [Pseudoponticoccus marisrubri]